MEAASTANDPVSIRSAGLDPLIAAVAALIVYAIVFPRSAAAIFLVPVVLALGQLIVKGGHQRPALPVGPLLASTLALALWSMITAAWSAAPLASLSKPLFFMGGAIGIGILAILAPHHGKQTLQRVALGILFGSIIGGAFLCIETIWDQPVTRFFYNLLPVLRSGQEKHLSIENGVVMSIAENNINRRAAIVTLLLIPAALAAASAKGARVRWGGLASLFAIAAILMRFSGHQSSQAAIAAAGVAFLLARVSPKWTAVLAGAAWCISCLLVVPIVLSLHATGVHKDENGLFLSARHRIVIWNYTAEQVLKAPFFGVGADSTAAITLANEQSHSSKLTPKDGQFEPTAARHAHNVFLQTWYELGAVGALIFTAMGIFALTAITSARASLQPFLIAEFAAIAGMIAFSFGIWQLWFQGAIGLAILALLVGVAAQTGNEADQ